MTTSTEHLKGIIRDSAEMLLTAERIESASIPMGDKLILIGQRSELARMLDYSTEAAHLSAMTGAARLWLGLNAAGQVAQFWTKEPDASAYSALRIVPYVCLPLIREGDPAPGAAAASIPAGPELIRGFDLSLASVDAHDPQSFIDGAKWAEQKILAAPPVAPAPESQPSDDDLLEVARCLCSMAARRAEMEPEKRKHYPHVDEEGSPLLDAARAACLARGYTEDGLAVEGVGYPVAAPVPAASEGWTENTGMQPVQDGARVDVEFINGEKQANLSADEFDWARNTDEIEAGWEIVRWRPAAPATSDKAEEL